MGGFWRDVQHAARLCVRAPGFAAVVILMLAIGIGGNTAIFSVIRGVLLAPLPYRDPERVVQVFGHSEVVEHGSVSVPEYLDYGTQTTRLEGLAAWSVLTGNLIGGGPPERVSIGAATASFFPLLGVAPRLGRSFEPEEEQVGRDQVVVLTHGFWQRRFGGDPAIVGRSVQIDRDTYRVLGVLPARFWFPDAVDLWMPLAFHPMEKTDARRGSHNLHVLARMKRGVTLAEAQAEMDVIGARLRDRYPQTYPAEGRWHPALVPFRSQIVADVELQLWMLIGAVGLVLLIACANVANLLLARGSARQREMAVRAALGAGRQRLVRQLVTENLLLTAVGSALGLLGAIWGIDLLLRLGPSGLPRGEEVRLDGTVLVFTFVLSTFTGLVTGSVPAFAGSRVSFQDALRAGGNATLGRRMRRLGRGLVVVEVALALILLSGSVFLIRSLAHVLRVEPGFEVERVETFRVTRPTPNGPSSEADLQGYRRFFEAALERLGHVPGVVAVGGINRLPLAGFLLDNIFEVEGAPVPPGSQRPDEEIRTVLPGYFETMRMALIRGRTIDRGDRHDAIPVILVNQAFAEKYWPGRDPLGKRIRLEFGEPRWWTVVGVVANVRERGLDAGISPIIYLPFAQYTGASMTLVLRTTVDASIGPAARAALADVDPDQPIYDVSSMRQRLSRSLEQRRFTVVVLDVFAVLALLMAALGLYAVLSQSVAARRREIGIRMALGARQTRVISLVARESAVLVLAGAPLGVVGSLVLSRFVTRLFYGVEPGDPLTFGLSLAVLGIAASLASWLPARRAARVDPLLALQSD
ncbi:MAG TPA: ABC transporter permease [Myxococcaceae bacterium]